MRTTIDLPDPLFHSIKGLALQRKISLKVFVTNALEAALKAPAGAPARMETPPITRPGGVIPALSRHEVAALLEAEDHRKAGL